jgi:hypothetical protein
MISDQEYYSVKETYKLLHCLVDPQVTPRIPKLIRDAAKKCLQHYPIDKSYDEILLSVDFWNARM